MPTYTVKQGDTLGDIAYSVGSTTNDLVSLNPQYKSNPNLIKPGEIINLPYSQVPDTINTGALTSGVPSSGSTATPLDIQSQINSIQGTINTIAPQIYALNQPKTAITPSGAIVDVATGQIIKPAPESAPPSTPTPSGTASSQLVAQQTEDRTGLFDKIINYFTGNKSTETPQEIVERILPKEDPRISQIDIDLANLETAYQTGLDDLAQKGETLTFVRGQQEKFQRQYELKRQNLLLKRDAYTGAYDRALQRGRLILDLELEQRKEEREDKKFAIDIMLAQADAEEAVFLTRLRAQLDAEAENDRLTYQSKIDEQNEIQEIISKNQEAFGSFFGGGGTVPKTTDEALRIASKYNEPILKDERALETAKSNATIANLNKSGGVSISGFEYDKSDIDKVAITLNIPQGNVPGIGAPGINYVLSGFYNNSIKEIENSKESGYDKADILSDINTDNTIPDTIKTQLIKYVNNSMPDIPEEEVPVADIPEEQKKGFWEKILGSFYEPGQ